MTKEDHRKAVLKIKEDIKNGLIFQCEVGFKSYYRIKGNLTEIYSKLRSLNPSPHMYFMKFDDQVIIGASPELLFRLKNGEMETFPLAGTTKRGSNKDEDLKLARELLNDSKEIAEHNMLVDLHRNDLGRVAKFGTVKVRNLMDIKKYSHVQHISSEIAANAAPGPDGESMLEDMENNGLEYHSGWDCCVPQIFWTYVVFYDPDAFPGEKPDSRADFFDTEKFPGKRGIHTWATGIIEKAMVADGVSPNAVPTVLANQTGAIDRAFEVMDRIKDDVVFWSAGSQPLELVKSGEVIMAIAYNGRVGAANLAEGENFEYIWEGQVLDQEYLCLTAGAPNRDAAIDFMMHASTPEAQAEQAKYITYGPMRASGIPIIQNNEPWGPGGVDIMPHMPNTPERLKVSIVSDPQWWSDYGAEINERYAAWMGN